MAKVGLNLFENYIKIPVLWAEIVSPDFDSEHELAFSWGLDADEGWICLSHAIFGEIDDSPIHCVDDHVGEGDGDCDDDPYGN